MDLHLEVGTTPVPDGVCHDTSLAFTADIFASLSNKFVATREPRRKRHGRARAFMGP